MSSKRKFLHNVVNKLINESKLIWKPTKLIRRYRDNGWSDVRVAAPFNNHKTTPSQYFKGEGAHQDLFKVGFEDFVQDIYALSEGETYYVYHLYLKEMFTKISYFIRENMETSEELNEVINTSTEKIKYSDAFLEKVMKYIKKRYPEVVDIKKDKHPWFKGWKEFIHVYVDEDDGQPTDIAQHPLEWKIHWDVTDTLLQGLDSSIDIKVTNLNKDTKLRSSVRESINESRKDIKKEQDDIERAVQDLNRIHNFDVSYDDIVKEIKRSTPTKITDEIWGDLQNTESNQIQFGDFNSVFNLSNKYNKSNPLKLKKKIEQNEYKYPIIVRFNDQYHLVSGNTRLCTAAAMGEYLDVIIADINKPFPVDEGKIYKKNNV